ncbi:unnamed protein product [Ilex paraguariensis]|uniref:Uncharacterized protein n=1 Tax=Ilex paraguariensis TaxID=185542 RepID=A0ABC8RJZ8_9AQUA
MKMRSLMVLVATSIVFMVCGCVLCKECTNSFPELSSHTLRAKLLASNNESQKQKLVPQYQSDPLEVSVQSNLIPRKILKEEDESEWAIRVTKVKNSDKFELDGGFLKEVSLHDVRLDPNSIHGQAQQTNLEYLLMLDVDRLVWSFRKTAGLPTSGKPYGGWEAQDCELRGHFVGHYMSASAQMWASTHSDSLKEKMSAVVSALSACQHKMSTGYLSAFPSEFFDRVEALKQVWAPYYTIHKILAGLLDQHILAGNAQALKMVTWMVEYFYTRVQNVISKYSIEQHWQSLNEETGGMNDVLYRLYRLTGDQRHLSLAHLFDKPCFLGLLAVKADGISGFHANTHIPVVIGALMRHEVTGDPLHKEIGMFFMDIVNSSHSYATGGTSVDEFWSEPKRLASTLGTENQESCTTYNMLKVSRHLFRWTKDTRYADYYERALTNGILGIQRGREPGVMIYMLPLGHGKSKARSNSGWGTKFDSFWCCYGTGIESFSKLGDSIYFEEEGKVPGLYIIQYISSLLDWKTGKIKINQKVDRPVSWDPRLRVTLTISMEENCTGFGSTLNLRIPIWTNLNGATALLNDQDLSVPAPGNFLSLSRKWLPGDRIMLELPITLRMEAIKDDRPKYASVQAILYGPYVLAGLTSGDWNIKTGSPKSVCSWIAPILPVYNSHLISLSQVSRNSTLVFSNSNKSITMEDFPDTGTDSSIHATFRLILNDPTLSNFSSPKDAIGQSVMLEPFDFPGMFVVHQETDEKLVVADSTNDRNSVFRLVPGLDRNDKTVSLESESQKGCFVHSGVHHYSGASVKLGCIYSSSGAWFNQAASFMLNGGISEYHPISFVAKSATRNFLLAPLLSLRDESYTVYFNIQSQEGEGRGGGRPRLHQRY